MQISDIEIRFPEGQRPVTIVTFDKPVLDAEVKYAVAREKDFQVNVFRGECGDYVRCGVESKPKRNEFPRNRFTLCDGTTRLSHALMPTNEVAVNALFRMFDPVMDVVIDDKEQGAIRGHVLADSVAKYLYAQYSGKQSITECPCMAVIEWASGIRVYEPVLAKWTGEKWTAEPNRHNVGDKIVFLATPDDKLSPLLEALDRMREPGQDSGAGAGRGA